MSNRTSFEIRFVRPSEAQRLSELIKGLQDHQQMNGVTKIPSKEDIVRDLFHKNEKGDLIPNNLGSFTAVVVDTSKSQVDDHSDMVGYLIYTVKFNLMRGRQLYLNSFFIEEPYRRHGLGRKMVRFMQAHGKLLGIDIFDVPFMKNNISGQKFYATFGAYLVDEEYNLMMAPPDI